MYERDTEQEKRANFEREGGATRHVSGRTWARARTTNGPDARSFLR